MTDNDLINNKLDLTIWLGYLFIYSSFNVYGIHSLTVVRRTMSNLTAQNINKVQVVKQIRVFSIMIFIMNLTYTMVGYLLLKKVGLYVLLILLHGGIMCFI